MRKIFIPLFLFAASCGAPPTPPCDPNTFTPRCDGEALVLCGGTNEVSVDCGDAACNAAEQRCGTCGDGAVQSLNEACDDGNTANGDLCSSVCEIEACGNGRLDQGEVCDDGNQLSGDGCQANCTLPNCGDGAIDANEQCDDGDTDNTDGCTTLCRLPNCGDGFVQAGEQCDDGNNINDVSCNADCKLPKCGDGIRAANEGCDDGNTIDGDGCQSDCSLPSCGDGSTDVGEGCDDGNNIDTDACPSTCQLASCGDGFVQANIEQCDDGNNSNDAACEADCTLPVCGNGIIDIGEQCDDHNLTSNDGCDSNCTLPVCGNGIVNSGEECDDANQNNGDGCTNQCTAVAVASQQPARSSSLAITEDDSTLVMANTDTGTVSLFDAATRSRIAEVIVGQPNSDVWAVATSPDSTKAFALLRNDGRLVEINNIDTPTPTVGRSVDVGAESVGLVLSPSGRTAYVTSFVEGAVYTVNTQSFAVNEIVIVGNNPYGLCMTNDGDLDDSDETLFVTQFYGLPSGIIKAGVTPLDRGSEGTDFGRKGVVHALRTLDNSLIQNVDLLPLNDTGFQSDLNNDGINDEASGAYPNQLANCTINGGRVYVPNMAASPRGAVKFNVNVQGLVSVFDATTLTEIPGNNVGSLSGTVNLNNLIKAQSAAGGGRQFFTNPSDIAFLPNTQTGFAVSSASDYVMPVKWNADGTITLAPAAGTFHIPMAENPIAMVIDSSGDFGYVANRVSRNLKVIDLVSQTVVSTVTSAAVPAANQAGFNELKGLKFFNTSAVRWSVESWGACSGCHPGGLSDNATWHFAAGPRQTISLDQTYSKKNSADQRILNWTGIFDEVHDFNLNALNVSGAAASPKPGAIVTDLNNDTIEELVNVGAVDTNGDATNENHNGLNGSSGHVVDSVSINKGWNQIDAYVKTLRPMKASRLLDQISVARGRQVFINNNCQNCHGGDKWTISRRSFTPDLNDAIAVVNASNARKTTALSTAALGILNQNTFLVSAETIGFTSPYDATLQVVASAATALLRVSCVLRDVGTYGLVDPVTGVRDVRIEVAANMTAQAEGIMGFNPPSLFSLSVSAPYLHHGQAQTLEELFSPTFKTHHQAESANFLATLQDANPNNDAQALQDRADLIAFLLSIDETTATIAPAAGQDICPNL